MGSNMHKWDTRQSKTLILSMNVDQKSLGTTGDIWQSKTMLLVIFDPRLSIIKSIFYRPLSGVMQESANMRKFGEEGIY